jgi:DNA invertase Pin-like site-specific DNA recombinase
MLNQARERSFDVVIVEAHDRLSRDMEDLAGIHKRLSFLGIEIRAVHEGVDTPRSAERAVNESSSRPRHK